ncbi:MAG: hypothetical protein CMK08_07505 [Ponticaulis sp.]|nr:hypothetical protein [Ponticaulis sp.]
MVLGVEEDRAGSGVVQPVQAGRGRNHQTAAMQRMLRLAIYYQPCCCSSCFYKAHLLEGIRAAFAIPISAFRSGWVTSVTADTSVCDLKNTFKGFNKSYQSLMKS